MKSNREKIRQLETVKRRRDWVTIAGLVFFGLILIAEAAVAVGVPLLVRRENVLAAEIIRLKTIEAFDGARFVVTKALESGRTDLSRYELTLLYTTMNLFANYMHENIDRMTTEQFLMVQERTGSLRAIAGQMQSGSILSRRNEVNTRGALERLAAVPVQETE